MAERRQASRREPIEVEVRGQVFLAKPLPWQVAGDLGNEIVGQNTKAVNEAVVLYVEGDTPQLDLKLAQKISDWNALLRIAFPDNATEDFVGFDIDECAVLVLSSLEVNHLEHLNHLVDPNFLSPTNPGGTELSAGTMMGLGPKIESILDSSSSDSVEQLPLTSLEVNS